MLRLEIGLVKLTMLHGKNFRTLMIWNGSCWLRYCIITDYM